MTDGRWLLNCKCKCGNFKVVSVRNLQRGVSKHCGCSPASNNKGLPMGVAACNGLISSYKSNARYKNNPFELSREECVGLFQGNCAYCGALPAKIFKKKNIKGFYTYNGIDRIDSSKGYVPTNVVSCCMTCNFLKGNKPKEVFLAHIKQIAEYLSL